MTTTRELADKLIEAGARAIDPGAWSARSLGDGMWEVHGSLCIERLDGHALVARKRASLERSHAAQLVGLRVLHDSSFGIHGGISLPALIGELSQEPPAREKTE